MHWAMILHPPATFIGYAAMTIPSPNAISALSTADLSERWVELCDRMAVFGFIFLSIGMGLGAVWAYVVLGWGGFWAWDAVENASLMSWLTCVAMIHSFSRYRKRGIFKRWSMLSATITFIFVVLGTFITRSGLVQSVHAFAEDPVSTYFFLAIMVVIGLAFLLGVAYRHAEFGEDDGEIESMISKNGSYYLTNIVMLMAGVLVLAIMVVSGLAFLLGVAYRHAEFGEDDGEIESMISKNGSYYLTNIVMRMAGVLVAYLTVSSALPSWMPLGGAVVAAGAYNPVARPVAVFVVLLMAVCPMLGWRKTDRAKFARHMRVPAIAGAAGFVALMAYFALVLVPEYHEIIAAGGAAGEALTEQGPAVYYFGLTALAFASAALLFKSSLYLLGRGVRGRMRAKGEGKPLALVNLFRHSPAQAGGYLCHLGVAIVVVGLVGSMMYVREATVNLAGEAGELVRVGAYELTFTDSERYSDDQNNEIMRVELDVTNAETGRPLGHVAPSMKVAAATSQTTLDAAVITFPLNNEIMRVELDVTNAETGRPLGHVAPSMKVAAATSQTTLDAAVITFPLEDLFVAFQGLNPDGSLSLNVKVNPLILVTWAGGAISTLGIELAFAPRRATPRLAADERERAAAAQGAER